jgi:hypothetical protein
MWRGQRRYYADRFHLARDLPQQPRAPQSTYAPSWLAARQTLNAGWLANAVLRLPAIYADVLLM